MKRLQLQFLKITLQILVRNLTFGFKKLTSQIQILYFNTILTFGNHPSTSKTKRYKIILEIILNWLTLFVVVMKNYSYKRTVEMFLLITIVFNFFVARICIFLFMLWEIFFRSKTVSFGVRLFLSVREFFFWCESFLSPWGFYLWCETFDFPVRIYLPRENVYTENYSVQSENFGSTIKEGFSRLCGLCFVLWARPFYSLEKEEV